MKACTATKGCFCVAGHNSRNKPSCGVGCGRAYMGNGDDFQSIPVWGFSDVVCWGSKDCDGDLGPPWLPHEERDGEMREVNHRLAGGRMNGVYGCHGSGSAVLERVPNSLFYTIHHICRCAQRDKRRLGPSGKNSWGGVEPFAHPGLFSPHSGTLRALGDGGGKGRNLPWIVSLGSRSRGTGSDEY